MMARLAVPWSRNLPGIAEPAVDAMIATLLKTDDPEDYAAAVKALDRLLTAGRYVVPLWYADRARLAHDVRVHYPDTLPIYGLYPGFYPETFWMQE